MQLKDFLLTADADHAVALQQAHDYQPLPYVWRIEGSVRKTQVETSNIVNGTEERLTALIDDPATDEQKRQVAVKVLRALKKLYKPEFYINLADPEVSALFSAAQALVVLILDEVTRITAAALYTPDKPFERVTLHDVLLTRNAVPFADVTINGGYAVLTTTADCPVHPARILATNPRTGNETVLGRVSVGAAGVYEFKVPTHYLDFTSFKIDDAYGVI